MPDVQEVFRMATRDVSPDPGALERQHRNQRRHVVRQKAGGYALAAGLVTLGVVIAIGSLRHADESMHIPRTEPGDARLTAGLPPTTGRLAGIWLVEEETEPLSLLARFSPDGTYAFDNLGLLDTHPAAAGTYEISGRTISFLNGSSRICPEGDRWAWRAGVPEDGRLYVDHLDVTEVTDDVDDDCDARGRWILTRVSPSSRAGSLITAHGLAGQGVPPSSDSALSGIWLLEGGGHLVRFASNGTYAIDDTGRLGTGPDDAGTFTVDGRGNVSFTSGASSRACAEGSLSVWEEVRVGADTLRAVVGEDGCPTGIGPVLTWVRLSP